MSTPKTVPLFSQIAEATQENRPTPTTERLASIWAYFRQELLYLCYALLEVALLTPLALSLMGWARYWSPGQVLLWLLLLMLLPLNITRLMSLVGLNRTQQLRVTGILLFLTIILSWRTLLYTPTSLLDFSWLRQFYANLAEAGSLVWTRDLSIFLLVIWTWWRGLRLAARHHEISRMGLRLRVGGLILAPFVIWFASNFLLWSVVPYLMLFFLAGLTAVALVRVEQMEQEQSGQLATLNIPWLATIILAGLGVTLLPAIIASIISGESLFFVLSWLTPVLAAVQFGGTATALTLYHLGQPFLNLFAIIIQFLANILAYILSFAGNTLQRLTQGNEGILAPLIPTPTATVEVTGASTGSKVGVLLLMVLAIVLVTFALVRLYRQATVAAREGGRSHSDEEEEQESGIGRSLLERLGLLRSWRAAYSIRRIYQQMCRAAEGAGYPRQEFQTPYEFLPTLGQVWPGNTAASRLITNAFVKVRYGEVPESHEELEAIRNAWRQLEATEPNRRDTNTTSPKLMKKE